MRFRSPEYEAFLKEVEARHSATLIVRGSINLPAGIEAFKIYVDGNIHRTPARLSHLANPSQEVIALIPGRHRIVVRDAEVGKTDRAESNTVIVEFAEGEKREMVVKLDDGLLALVAANG
jgi:hypothetical protein